MATFKDFLIWYNNLDEGHFFMAVERWQLQYFDEDLDVYKTTISLPGLARQMFYSYSRQTNDQKKYFSHRPEKYRSSPRVDSKSFWWTFRNMRVWTCLKLPYHCQVSLGKCSIALSGKTTLSSQSQIRKMPTFTKCWLKTLLMDLP